MIKNLCLLLLTAMLACNELPESEPSTHFRIYPNPGRDNFIVEVRNEGADDYDLKVFSPTAEILLHESIPLGNYRFRVRAEKKGYYTIVLKSGSNEEQAKFLSL